MNNIYEYVLMAGIKTTFIFVYFLSIRSLKGTGSELVFGPWCSGTDRMQRTSGRWSWASWKPESGEHVGFQTWRKCEATRPRRSRGTHTAVSCSPGLSYVTQVFWGQISVLRAGDTSDLHQLLVLHQWNRRRDRSCLLDRDGSAVMQMWSEVTHWLFGWDSNTSSSWIEMIQTTVWIISIINFVPSRMQTSF